MKIDSTTSTATTVGETRNRGTISKPTGGNVAEVHLSELASQSVSYTHLDVYKRQRQITLGELRPDRRHADPTTNLGSAGRAQRSRVEIRKIRRGALESDGTRIGHIVADYIQRGTRSSQTA